MRVGREKEILKKITVHSSCTVKSRPYNGEEEDEHIIDVYSSGRYPNNNKL